MCAVKARKAAIVGTVGVPANYGGFETLVDNLVTYHDGTGSPLALTVYCSSKAFDSQPETYRKARLRYVGLDANGVQSIPYDIVSILDAVRRGHDRLLLLGVSGALILPVLRLFSRARIVINVDGIEWKREKWRGVARRYLRFAEKIAVRFSDEVIADNKGIADYLRDTYGCEAHVIPYGGDHAVEPEPDPVAATDLPDDFALGLCRIEPENNIDMILEAFETLDTPLVFVGNWDKSAYGRELKRKYAGHPTITIHDPVYDLRSLRAIRNKASLYLHGHSAGGTNPALVEMMHFGIPIAAYNCSFNRYTTEQKALYFSEAGELRALVGKLTKEQSAVVGEAMQEIARRRYTWAAIGRAYFELLEA
jgi:glycosyltransferase involved in cell wall biosynthesis|tara:strand:+ start:6098 stop:7192 length:1095 start_codon:yes stop_codon:yes gene_type:complete